MQKEHFIQIYHNSGFLKLLFIKVKESMGFTLLKYVSMISNSVFNIFLQILEV